MASASSSASFFGIREGDQNQMKQQLQQQQQQQQSSTPTLSTAPTTAPQKKKRNLPGTPNPDAEVIALSPKTLMATNRFICEVCNKGFQREQNLQLHRRGHNLPWKLRQKTTKEVKRKVYLCPEPTCVHHDPSRALGDLTGIKKHFCRKHGEKKWKCDKCSKRYAVQSDWKAHSKTCGTREYRCDCGTLFSRRDSFITHRAFCDALAQETARLPTNLSTMGSHLYGSSNMGLGLSQMGSQISIRQDQNHQSTDMLRLGGAAGAAQFDHIIPQSNASPFRAPQSTPPSAFFLQGSSQDFHEEPQSHHGLLQNKSFHGLMQLPDLQNNTNNTSSATAANLFNLSFFSNSNSTSSINNSNSSNGGNNHLSSSGLLIPDHQFNNGNASGEGNSLFSGNMMGEHIASGVSSLYNTPVQNESIIPQMSATALLQKAAQMGSTTSGNGPSLLRSFGSSSSGSKSDRPQMSANFRASFGGNGPSLLRSFGSELSSIMSISQRSLKASLSVVELTVALHQVFHAPVDKILWDVGEQSYAHKIITGRRSLMHTLRQKNGLSASTSRYESEYDPFGAGHGCSSISAGLGMAVARDIKGKRDRIVTVISNESTMAGQVYEAMSNAGYLDSDMIVILNDSRHSLHPKLEEGPKTSISALSSTLSKIQSSKYFRKFREAAKGMTKRIGKGMYELAAKVDEYARGLVGPIGSTLFEELGLYYVGPVDGHNIEDLICVLQEVSSLNSTGPVLVHVITNEYQDSESDQKSESALEHKEGLQESSLSRTYSDFFVEALVSEAEKDQEIVIVHAGMGMDPSLQIFQARFPDKFFDVGMAEQHAVTFSAGLSCGGLKPFCIIPSTFLQRAYDQVVHDVDRQRLPVRFAITSAGLVGSDGPMQCGPFDIAFMSCLPNMIVMAPSDENELVDMVATAAQIEDRPVCFRYPRGAIVGMNSSLCSGIPLEIGKGKVLAEGKDIAFLGYGVMVQNCLKARSLLANFGIMVTVADARFCKPLDIKLVRQLCEEHSFLITVEEGSVGGFGSHVSQFIALDGQLDGKIKWRPIVLPDNYIEHASPTEQLALAGLTGHHIAATALALLGRTRDALQLMC